MDRVTLLVIYCIFYLSLKARSVQSITPDYEYNSALGGFVKQHKVPANWTEARLRCYYEGGVLMSPINEVFAAAMVSMVQTGTPPMNVYTGIHSLFSHGDFLSVEGIPLYAMNLTWHIGYPGIEECTIMMTDGTIIDYNCNCPMQYICYVKAPAAPIIFGFNNEGYKLDKRTGSYYKVHPLGRTWKRAFMTCMAEGAHLAIINSDVEAEVIVDLLKEYPQNKIIAEYKDVASIGYLDWGERESWWTIHGQELSEAGYAKWDKSQPNGAGTQLCGGVNRNGKLNDLWCNQKSMPLICEIEKIGSTQ